MISFAARFVSCFFRQAGARRGAVDFFPGSARVAPGACGLSLGVAEVRQHHGCRLAPAARSPDSTPHVAVRARGWRGAVLLLLAAAGLAAGGVARAQSTLFAEDTGVLPRSGAVASSTFTLGSTRTLVLRVVADYGIDAGIFTPSGFAAFSNGQATTGWALFNNTYGTSSVTLAAGSYVVAVRSRASTANNFRYELDYDFTRPGERRLDSQTRAEYVGANGGRLWQPFTIGSGHYVWIDGANLGLEFYLLPADELDNFRAGRTFRYFSDYGPAQSSNQPGGFHVNLAPGSYLLAFRNSNTIQKAVTYTIEWWSGGATGTPTPPPPPAVVAPAITTQPQGRSVTAGGAVSFTVAASGTTPTYQWRKNGTAIPGATGATFSIGAATTGDAGTYTVVVSNSSGSVTSAAATLTVTVAPPTPPPPAPPPNPITPTPTPPASAGPARLVNLSIRTNAGTGAQTLIVGFVVGGAGTGGTKPLLVRGIGPSLGQFGVTGALVDPQLQLFSGATMITSNNDWGGSAAAANAFSQAGAFALAAASRDAALMPTLGGGLYSAQISGGAAGAGVALAEIYDLTAGSAVTASTPRLVNISARAQAGSGADTLIAGFVVSGTGSKTVLIRAIGPGLAQFGVSGVLTDPELRLYQGSTLIGSNDDWGGTAGLTTAFGRVGAFALPAGSWDAALLVTLQAGTYSAQVSGIGGATGVALVEVYELP